MKAWVRYYCMEAVIVRCAIHRFFAFLLFFFPPPTLNGTRTDRARMKDTQTVNVRQSLQATHLLSLLPVDRSRSLFNRRFFLMNHETLLTHTHLLPACVLLLAQAALRPRSCAAVSYRSVAGERVSILHSTKQFQERIAPSRRFFFGVDRHHRIIFQNGP